MIAPEVASRWIAFNTPFEARVRHLYLDCLGLPTTAIGCLVKDLVAMLALPWLTAASERATDGEIVAEYNRVRSMPGNLPASRYASPDGLHLAEEAIDELVMQRLDATAAALACFFDGFGGWPWQAQMAACSMAWAVGTGEKRPGLCSPEWPKLQAALRAQDWVTAAAECALTSPGTARRNEANRELFLAVAEAT